MNEEEIDDIIEKEVWARVEELTNAMRVGNYKRANELLGFFLLPFTEKGYKNKTLEDIMVA